ncbi:glycoside hydrolase [Morchella conica CCBAS932]|uniref:Glycoside hydrolase n=1 Tax=Morchella conica CCBAS932 TaxID=1392247 RepID=A0A3N4KL48_9PEZI|nr:glycoside hydrolase [Morchella conica CCBAS932]
MRSISSLLVALALSPMSAMAAREVFAHYMVGNTYGQTLDDWAKDIQLAKAASIDGFALNAGPTDSYGEEQLDLAYQAAEANNFKLFISFDMLCCGTWDVSTVAKFINAHKDSSAQFKVGGKPMVSTFEGTNFVSQWSEVESSTGQLFLVPDWASMGPQTFATHLDVVDGAFVWDAWPLGTTPATKTTDSDNQWISAINGKPYMMAVSPWFYTRLPQYSKNWNWDSDTLWFDRWESVIDVLPQYVEIITWNDYGESHYIGPIRSQGIVSGAEVYVNNMPHDAWRFILPYYIAAYKAGTRDVTVPTEGAMFWYRTTPKAVCGDGSTTCGNAGTGGSAVNCVRDSVFVVTASNTATSVEVTIGGQGKTFSVPKGVKLVELPFSGRVGDVVVKVNGKTATGPAKITNSCPSSGYVNFNAVVGSTS